MNGNITSITYPSGRVVNYSYINDRINNVNTVKSGVTTPLVSSIAYKPYGGVASLTYGNAVSRTISYDQRYQITKI